MFQRTCVLRDITDNYEMDLNTAYCVVMGTGKHVASSWTESWHLEKTLEMLHIMAGGEAAWRARPFVSQFQLLCGAAHEVRDGIAGMPAGRGSRAVCRCCCCPQDRPARRRPPAWPAPFPQAWAECLGGLVYVNAIEPGAPAILGAWPFVSDLRTGAMSGGSPEQGLLSAACAQMSNVYNLPFGTACGMTDAKFPDFQAGAERAATTLAAALSGSNLIYESAGMYASAAGYLPREPAAGQ